MACLYPMTPGASAEKSKMADRGMNHLEASSVSIYMWSLHVISAHSKHGSFRVVGLPTWYLRALRSVF